MQTPVSAQAASILKGTVGEVCDACMMPVAAGSAPGHREDVKKHRMMASDRLMWVDALSAWIPDKQVINNKERENEIKNRQKVQERNPFPKTKICVITVFKP